MKYIIFDRDVHDREDAEDRFVCEAESTREAFSQWLYSSEEAGVEYEDHQKITVEVTDERGHAEVCSATLQPRRWEF